MQAYGVERIVNYRERDNRFLVKWEGNHRNSWEPAAHVAGALEAVNDFFRRNPHRSLPNNVFAGLQNLGGVGPIRNNRGGARGGARRGRGRPPLVGAHGARGGARRGRPPLVRAHGARGGARRGRLPLAGAHGARGGAHRGRLPLARAHEDRLDGQDEDADDDRARGNAQGGARREGAAGGRDTAGGHDTAEGRDTTPRGGGTTRGGGGTTRGGHGTRAGRGGRGGRAAYGNDAPHAQRRGGRVDDEQRRANLDRSFATFRNAFHDLEDAMMYDGMHPQGAQGNGQARRGQIVGNLMPLEDEEEHEEEHDEEAAGRNGRARVGGSPEDIEDEMDVPQPADDVPERDLPNLAGVTGIMGVTRTPAEGFCYVVTVEGRETEMLVTSADMRKNHLEMIADFFENNCRITDRQIPEEIRPINADRPEANPAEQ